MTQRSTTAATMITTIILGFGLSYWVAELYGQTEEPAGEMLLRSPDGTVHAVTQVTTSQQAQYILAELGHINAKLDQLLEYRTPTKETSVVVNTATYEEILTIPGIGPVKAGALIMARDTPVFKPFVSWQDLQQRVAGIGPGTVADMQAAGVTLSTSPTQ